MAVAIVTAGGCRSGVNGFIMLTTTVICTLVLIMVGAIVVVIADVVADAVAVA